MSFLFGHLGNSQARWPYCWEEIKDTKGKCEGLVRREDKVLSSRAATHRGMESGGFPYWNCGWQINVHILCRWKETFYCMPGFVWFGKRHLKRCLFYLPLSSQIASGEHAMWENTSLTSVTVRCVTTMSCCCGLQVICFWNSKNFHINGSQDFN